MSNYDNDYDLQNPNENKNKNHHHDSSINSDHNPSSKLQYTNPNFYTNPQQNKNKIFHTPITKSSHTLNPLSYDSNIPRRPEKKENSFTMNNKSQIEGDEFSTLSQDAGANKLRMQLMEKDKIIIGT